MRGQRYGNGFFGVIANGNDKGWPRLGLAVAVRASGGAVERNRLRRIIRESFRLHQRELPSVDLIVSARSAARNAPPAELRSSLEGLWKTVASKSRGPGAQKPAESRSRAGTESKPPTGIERH